MDNEQNKNLNPNVGKRVNPLSQWYRQPKVYIKLPSKGNFYPNGSLDYSTTGDYAVFAMTAKDELMFKTPDALLNGQSTVEVIKSCVPAILDPWMMPSIDVDALLIAIRIATYGEKMEVSANCPNCNAENTYELGLTQWLEKMSEYEFAARIEIGELVVNLRPYTYQEMTKAGLKTLEHQRIFQIINDEDLPDEEKLAKFGKSFVKLTELTVDIIADTIARIDTPDGFSDDKNEIRDFLNNAPREIFHTIQTHVTDLKDKMGLPTPTVKCSSCETEFLMPISFDQSNFFDVRS
jgi:hypothetical protein